MTAITAQRHAPRAATTCIARFSDGRTITRTTRHGYTYAWRVVRTDFRGHTIEKFGFTNGVSRAQIERAVHATRAGVTLSEIVQVDRRRS
jgi:hypothetical protein